MSVVNLLLSQAGVSRIDVNSKKTATGGCQEPSFAALVYLKTSILLGHYLPLGRKTKDVLQNVSINVLRHALF